MKTFDTKKEFKNALEKSLGRPAPEELFKDLMIGRNPPYGDGDFEEVLSALGGKTGKATGKTLPEIINAIADELTLWQEIKLHLLEPQLREVRKAMFGAPKRLSIKKAKTLIDDFLKAEDTPVRVAYVHLFIERTITAYDMTRYFSELKPNQYECLLAVMALITNRSYLSGTEALWYFLTGQRIPGVGIFNPTMTLVTFRLAKYLQPGGRPTRSLLSVREKSLLRLMGTATGKPKPIELWLVWNKQNPNWAYDSWRMFWKACQRAKSRLLTTYETAFEIESRAIEDPQHFWELLSDST